MKKIYTTYDELPTALNANDVAQVLGLSRVGAYNLMNSSNFPTLRIGKRMLVAKENFIRWIDTNSNNMNQL